MTTFALCDINNFYASCETVFQPKLDTIPLLILANNDGCAVSRNNLAKLHGIKMGEPWFQVKERFEPGEVIALSSNYALYADMSNRVVNIISRFSPDYEVYSVDEQFLCWSGFEYRDLTQYGHELKRTILRSTGLPVCVGIASTKTLAKLANHCAKKQPAYAGVCNFNRMSAKTIDRTLAVLPVGEVWGIGSRLSAKLQAMNIHTVLDLKNAHAPTLQKVFSVVVARTIAELNGESCIELEQISPPKQAVASTRSFGVPVSDLRSLRESITFHVSQTAEKARKQHSYANSVTVFIKSSPFNHSTYYANSQTIALPSPSNDIRLLAKTANWILKRLYRPGFVYQKSGVILNDLVPAEGIQLDLFFDQSVGAQSIQSEKLMAVMDEINHRFGRQTLKLGSEGFNAPWKMKQNFKTPNYTCEWGGLLKVY
ncbi:MAG: translesion error-prone DNA polymerase V subunit UmuC [Methylococcales bacterium]